VLCDRADKVVGGVRGKKIINIVTKNKTKILRSCYVVANNERNLKISFS